MWVPLQITGISLLLGAVVATLMLAGRARTVAATPAALVGLVCLLAVLVQRPVAGTSLGAPAPTAAPAPTIGARPYTGGPESSCSPDQTWYPLDPQVATPGRGPELPSTSPADVQRLPPRLDDLTDIGGVLIPPTEPAARPPALTTTALAAGAAMLDVDSRYYGRYFDGPYLLEVEVGTPRPTVCPETLVAVVLDRIGDGMLDGDGIHPVPPGRHLTGYHATVSCRWDRARTVTACAWAAAARLPDHAALFGYFYATFASPNPATLTDQIFARLTGSQ